MMEILLFLLKRTCDYCYFVKSNVDMNKVPILVVSAMITNLKTNVNNNSIFVKCGDYVFFILWPFLRQNRRYPPPKNPIKVIFFLQTQWISCEKQVFLPLQTTTAYDIRYLYETRFTLH